jgi:hypothetical protein
MLQMVVDNPQVVAFEHIRPEVFETPWIHMAHGLNKLRVLRRSGTCCRRLSRASQSPGRVFVHRLFRFQKFFHFDSQTQGM